MAGEMTSAASHGWFSSLLYRMAHFGRGRREPRHVAADEWFSQYPASEGDGEPLEPRTELNATVSEEPASAATPEAEPPATGVEAATEPRPAEIVDPIERARAVLADARRQMPGMLGAPDDEAQPAPEPPAATSPADRLAAEWQAALSKLQADQERFLSRVDEELQHLLFELQSERQSLIEETAKERRELVGAFENERRRVLDSVAELRQQQAAQFDEERLRLRTEVMDLRGVLGELQGEVLRLMDFQPSSVPVSLPVPEYHPNSPPLLAPTNDRRAALEQPQAVAPAAVTGEGEQAGLQAATGRDEETGEPETEQPEAPCAIGELEAFRTALPASAATPPEQAVEPEPEPPSQPAQTAESNTEHPSADPLAGLVASLEERIRLALSRPLPFSAAVAPAEPQPLAVSRQAPEPPSGEASGSGAGDAPALQHAQGTPPAQPALQHEQAEESPPFTFAGWRDFGWRARPEAFAAWQLAQPSRSDEGVVRAAAAPGEGASEQVLPAEVPIALSVRPVIGIRRLSLLEQELSARPGALQVELASYRGEEAGFRLRFDRPVTVQDILETIAAAGGQVEEYYILKAPNAPQASNEASGGLNLNVTLARPSEDPST